MVTWSGLAVDYKYMNHIVFGVGLFFLYIHQ